MVNVTIERSAKLEKPMGMGYGRIVEGAINANWGSARTVLAADVGLRTITNMIVSAGTPLDIDASARVVAPGSVGNTARVRAFLRQKGTVTFGCVSTHRVYQVAFTGSPDIAISPGSTAVKTAMGSPPISLQTQRPGSFKARGTPTVANAHFIAVGPGSYPVNYVAIGD